ncbi:WD40 repeat domain-containing protein [Xenorhabdus thailandensis]|uniref:WD40 repeat domain-containing protein n=1 Tax=Xenorhabdus thailandensis TaxID=3136255 RepID=UPI0030F42C86
MIHSAPISGIAAYKNVYVATAGYDNRLILWDAKTHKSLAMGMHDHLVNQCAFSPCGTKLISASSDHSARIWQLPEMKLQQVINIHKDDVSKAAFSPSGNYIATCSYDCTLAVSDLAGNLISRMVGHENLIESFDWSQDSLTLTSVGMDGTIRTWDTKTGKLLDIIYIGNTDVDAIACISDKNKIIGNNEGYISLIRDGKEIKIKAHNSSIKKIAINNDGRFFATTSYDGYIIMWKLTDDHQVEKISEAELPLIAWPRSIAFLDDNTLVIGTFASSYLVWNPYTKQWANENLIPSKSLNSIHIEGNDIYTIGDAGYTLKNGLIIGGPCTLCNFITRFQSRLVCGGQSAELYDAITGKLLYKLDSPINCGISFTSNNQVLLAVGTYSGNVFIFSEKQCLKLLTVIYAHRNAIKGISYNSKELFCGCADGELSIIDPDNLIILHMIQKAHESILNDCSPFAHGFATVSRDLHLGLWGDEEHTDKIKTRHTHSIKCVAASDDGFFIACGSYSGVVDVYSVANKQWIGQPRRPTSSGISSLAWSENNHIFIAASYDGRCYEISVTE